jgi:hypothetical protein
MSYPLKNIDRDIQKIQDDILHYENVLSNAQGYDASSTGAFKLIVVSEIKLAEDKLKELNKKLEHLTDLRIKSILKSLK